jgi:hypothetical protein
MARRVRPDQRWDAGVGSRGGHPGSTAMKGRSNQPPPESLVRRAFSDTKIISVPGVEVVGELPHGKALIRRLLRRQAISPGGMRRIGRQGGWSRLGKRHDLATTTLGVDAAGKPRTEGFV